MKHNKLIPIDITEVHQAAAPPEDQRRGLIAFLAFTINGNLRLEGIALRRTANGRLALSYPAREVGSKHRRYFMRPLSNRARVAIEAQVFLALGLTQEDSR